MSSDLESCPTADYSERRGLSGSAVPCCPARPSASPKGCGH